MRDLPYDMCGRGPVLLIIPGGAGHPMGLEGAVARLADRFTVVTYDPLGLARGPLEGPVEDQRVQVWSENARQLLEAVLPDGESAYVFGSSSGGIAALDLLTRHPERVRHVVVHEPPVVQVLPDAARHRAMFAEVYETYRRAGVGPAAARLGAGLADGAADQPPAGAAAGLRNDAGSATEATADGKVGRDGEACPDGNATPGSAAGPGAAGSPPPATDASPTAAAPSPSTTGASSPMAIFLAHVLTQFTAFVPDLAALRALSGRLTPAAGHASRGQLLYRTNTTLAKQLGSEFVEFPGGHVGVAEHPVEFAERLAETLLPVGTPRVTPTT